MGRDLSKERKVFERATGTVEVEPTKAEPVVKREVVTVDTGKRAPNGVATV